MSEWQDFKKKGNSFYELWHFEEALEQYEKAIDIIEQEQVHIRLVPEVIT